MRALVGIVVALGIASASPVGAAASVGVAGEFAPVAVTSVGGPLWFVNLDSSLHNLVADAKRPDGTATFCPAYDPGACPLFQSPLLERSSAALVEGLEDVQAGQTYPFSCELHPSMTGTLVVTR